MNKEKFTKQEFNEYMDKFEHCKPFNDKEWNEFQYLIRGGRRSSPNYQAYLDYEEHQRHIRYHPITIENTPNTPNYQAYLDYEKSKLYKKQGIDYKFEDPISFNNKSDPIVFGGIKEGLKKSEFLPIYMILFLINIVAFIIIYLFLQFFGILP